MARRQFEVIDVVEVLQHWVGPGRAGSGPGGVGRAGAGLVPELVDAKARSLTFEVIEADREPIEDMLVTNTLTTVHQRLRDEHGLAVGISSFRRFVGSEFPDESLRERVTVLRPDVEAGEEALCGTPHRTSTPGSPSATRTVVPRAERPTPNTSNA
jgi:hypothetical protein